MHWKNELVMSSAQAVQFLSAQLGQMKIEPLRVDVDLRDGLAFSAETFVGDNRMPIITFEIETKHDVVWRNLFVGHNFRGKGLGLMAMKCALGVAHERAAQSLFLFQVCHDGLGFWPTMGAVPTAAPVLIGDFIEEVLDEKREEIPLSGLAELKQCLHLAQKDSYAAWRKLAQTDIRLKNGMRFKQVVIERMCAGHAMEFRLGDLSTQRILHQQIGSIPPFAPTTDRLKFLRFPQQGRAPL